MNWLKKLLVFTVFFTAAANAQLSTFNLQISKTNETCAGNASLTFSVSNTTPGAAILYKVYLLPNTTNPIAIQTGNTLNSLTAGTYSVVAVQSLGNNSNTAQANITIDNHIMPLDFSVSGTNEICATGGTIKVTPTSGIVTSYEIISGPVTRPLQTSGTFSNLPQGIYNIRVFNNCGTGKVKTFALVLVNGELHISEAYYPEALSDDCNYITINNKITPTAGTIPYPVTVEHSFDILNMAGDPLTFTQTYATGAPDMLEVSVVVPRMINGNGRYSVSVKDDCNTIYSKEDILYNNDIDFLLTPVDARCEEKYLVLTTSKVAAPYTVAFLSAPEGFDPAAFNSELTGPVSSPELHIGSENNTVPFGTYMVQLTDACGRSVVKELTVELVKPVPAVDERNSCYYNQGSVDIDLPAKMIVSAQIVSAPSQAWVQLPADVTAAINAEGNLTINSLPVGTYMVIFQDECGYDYQVQFEIEPFEDSGFKLRTRAACGAGNGALFSESSNQHLASVIVLDAPASFGQQLPFDISDYIIWNGDLYKNDFPEGNYTFKLIDKCGIEQVTTIFIEGYHPPQPGYVFSPQCSAFSVAVNDESNGYREAAYWLQKYNTATGKWGHPDGGDAYTEGEVPTGATGLRLYNGHEKNNLRFTGKFRIIKKFETFGNKTTVMAVCISILGEFNYSETLDFNSAYTLACLGQPHDVYLDVVGTPISYRIIERDGQHYEQDNGQSNIFRNLEPAEYTFSVEDYCGNRIVKRLNVTELPSIAEVQAPKDLVVCTEGAGTGSAEFQLADKTAEILGPLHASMYTVTYHLTEQDAENGTNALPATYTSSGNGQIVYARVEHNQIEICHTVTSFALHIGESHTPAITTTGTLCENETLILTAPAGYSSYTWSTGETTRTIFVKDSGIYSLIVEKAYGNGTCDTYTEIEIKQSSAPEILTIDTQDWTYDQNQITVKVEGTADYLYSIDGETWQEDNVFTGLENGIYNVYVKDAGGCGMDTKEVVLLNYPKFFTPNGDGYHDKWRIKYSIKEPHMKINIFDRFGKVVSSLGPNDEGWDGTFNGKQLPSTDYWFVVTREDGRELRGHFAMLR